MLYETVFRTKGSGPGDGSDEGGGSSGGWFGWFGRDTWPDNADYSTMQTPSTIMVNLQKHTVSLLTVS